MPKAIDLVEAGPPHRRNEQAMVVMDEAAHTELELSFFDHRQGRYIGDRGPTAQPRFFRAVAGSLTDGRRTGYTVGPEVTRFLRTGTQIGIASRSAPLGDVVSKVRPFVLSATSAEVRIKTFDDVAPPTQVKPEPPKPEPPKPEPPKPKPKPKPEPPKPEPPKPIPEQRKPEPPQPELKLRTFSAALLVVVAALLVIPAALAKLGYYDPVVYVLNSLDFVQKQSPSGDMVVFDPTAAEIWVMYPGWVQPFAGWWVPNRPPVDAKIPTDWLQVGPQRMLGHIVALKVSPKPGVLKQDEVLRSTLIFTNTNTGEVFANREATLRRAPLQVGELQIDASAPIVFSGPQGGPFSPDRITVGLKALGASFGWSIKPLPDGTWLGLSQTDGTLAANGSDSVAAFTTDAAAAKAPGSYDQPLVFEDKVTSATVQRTATLIVTARPAARLTVNAPQTEFKGLVGGPWTPASATMTLSASGGDLSLTVGRPDWFDVLESQRIPQGESVAVTLRPAVAAAGFGPGLYAGEIAFQDTHGKIMGRQPVRLTVLDPAIECDRLMGTRFEPDRPHGAAYLPGDVSKLSDPDVDEANAACKLAAATRDSRPEARRFLTQQGRALAAMAVRLAAKNDPSAPKWMNDARGLWEKAVERGSVSALNLLGYYWDGGFDNEAKGELPDVSDDKCAATQQPARVFATADPQKAYQYWKQAADATPPDPTAMNSLGFLLTNADETCPPATAVVGNFSKGIEYLKQAFALGYARAGEALGEWFILGHNNPRYPTDNFDRDVAAGLQWMDHACKDTSDDVALHRAEAFFARPRIMHMIAPATPPASCFP